MDVCKGKSQEQDLLADKEVCKGKIGGARQQCLHKIETGAKNWACRVLILAESASELDADTLKYIPVSLDMRRPVARRSAYKLRRPIRLYPALLCPSSSRPDSNHSMH